MIALTTDQNTEIDILINEALQKSRMNFSGKHKLPSNMKGVIGLCKMLLSLSEKYFTCSLMGRCIRSIVFSSGKLSQWMD